MKKITLLSAISLFLIFSGFACTKDRGSIDIEQGEPTTVCGSAGVLKRNLRGRMEWSDYTDSWVLKIDFSNKGDFKNANSHVDCNGFPEELQHTGLEIICDVKIKNDGQIRVNAGAIELYKYKIVSTSQNN